MKKLFVALFLTVLSAALAAADLTAVRRNVAFTLDGKLDEAFWAKAPAFSDYTNYRNSKRALCKTEIKFAYDNNALYVGIKAYMQPGSSYVINNSNLYAGECVELMLDPGATGNEYFHFMVNPAAAKADEFRMQGGFVGDIKWEAFWEAAAYKTPEYWSCELKIPFSSLDFPNADCKVWGVNATRTARNVNKDGLSEDSAIAADGAFHIAGKFRKLTGFDRDFAAYKGWQITKPAVSTSHAPDGIAVTAQLNVINNSAQKRRAMVSVDLLSPDKKDAQRQLRSTTFAPGKSETVEFSGYNFKNAGNYNCVISLKDGVTKRLLKKVPCTVPIRFQLMSIDLIDPHYKNAIFATMKLDKVRFKVNLAYPAKMLKGKSLTAGIRDAAGKVLASKQVSAAASVLFEFDAASLPEGKMEIFSAFGNASQPEAAAVCKIGTAAVGKNMPAALFQFIVYCALCRRHVAENDPLIFFRQIRCHLIFGTPFDEWRDPAGEFILQFRIIGDICISPAECRERAQQSRLKKIHNAPEVVGSIFQRRTGEDYPVHGADGFAVFGIGGTGVFDMLSLIQYQKTEKIFFQRCLTEFCRGI